MPELLSAERVATILQAINAWRKGPAKQQRDVYLETEAAVEALAEVIGEIPRLQALHATVKQELSTTQTDLQREKTALAEAKSALARFVDSARAESQKIQASLKDEHDAAVKTRLDRLAELDVKFATKARQLAALEEASAHV